MDWKEEAKLYEDAVKKFGAVAQIDQCIEEMAELTVALNKYKRKIKFGQGASAAEVLNAVNEERADVDIMLRQMDVLFGDNSEQDLKKLEHLKTLLEEYPGPYGGKDDGNA